MRFGLPHVLVPALILTLAGCSTPGPETSAAEPVAPTLGVSRLQRGMTADEVRALLGKPDQAAMTPTREGMAQLWTYRRRVLRLNQVAASTIAVPVYKGPGMGDANNIGTIDKPTDSNEHVILMQTIKVMLLDGKVAEWKVSEREIGRTYD